MQIKLNNENYITEFATVGNIPDAIDVDDLIVADMERFRLYFYAYKYENGQLVLDKEKVIDAELERQKATLRQCREEECFSIINQIYVIDGVAKTWFDTLTAEQKEEATAWVQAWRDVTETLIVPTQPSWLVE